MYYWCGLYTPEYECISHFGANLEVSSIVVGQKEVLTDLGTDQWTTLLVRLVTDSKWHFDLCQFNCFPCFHCSGIPWNVHSGRVCSIYLEYCQMAALSFTHPTACYTAISLQTSRYRHVSVTVWETRHIKTIRPVQNRGLTWYQRSHMGMLAFNSHCTWTRQCSHRTVQFP